MRSDAVSLGSHVWPALLPAHSSASEPAAPTLARDTHCIVLLTSRFTAATHLTARIYGIVTCLLACLYNLKNLPAHLSSTPMAECLLCKAATALDVFLPLEERWKLSLQDLHSGKWKDKRDKKEQEEEEKGRVEKSKPSGQKQAEVWDMWQVMLPDYLCVHVHLTMHVQKMWVPLHECRYCDNTTNLLLRAADVLQVCNEGCLALMQRSFQLFKCTGDLCYRLGLPFIQLARDLAHQLDGRC